MRVRAIFAKNAINHGNTPRVEHLFAVDTSGRLWERFSNDEPGLWSEIPLPKRDAQKQKRSERR